MHITVPTIAISVDGALDIADHRECHAGVAGEVLPKAQTSCGDALIAGPDLLQLGELGPVAVHAGVQSIDAVDVEIKLNEPFAADMSRGQESGELGEQYRSGAALKVEGR